MATMAFTLTPNSCGIQRYFDAAGKCGLCCARYARSSSLSSPGRSFSCAAAPGDYGDPASWTAALEGLEFQEGVESPENYWHSLKYKAPWVHADESQPRVTQSTWKKKDPVVATISGYPLGYEKTSINPPLAAAYGQYQQQQQNDPEAGFPGGGFSESSAISQIAENLRRIKGPKKDERMQQQQQPVESRIGTLVKRLNVAPAVEPVAAAKNSIFPTLNKGWSTPDHLLVEPAAVFEKVEKVPPKFPWEVDDYPEFFDGERREPRIRPPSLADLTIPDAELKRLRSLMAGVKERIKLKKLGVTRGVVEAIHQKWRTSEIVKLKCVEEVALNMRKTREELEKRTGGLVIWHAGGALVIYRGKDYSGPPTPRVREKIEKRNEPGKSNISGELTGLDTQFKEFVNHVPFIEEEYEIQMDKLLAELGPRCRNWTGSKPVPVDGDKLPEIDHTFKSPYRLLPYGVDAKLNDREFTNLVRLARLMPPQFVVSRNKGLQGLAKAMVKLWEKTEITKVAIKRNVQSTNNQRMADELKRLTGCVLLGRDKDFMIFYRGKDFLPAAIAAAFEEREAMAFANEDVEDRSRMLPTGQVAANLVHTIQRPQEIEADIKLKEWLKSQEEEKRRAIAMKTVRAARARRIERRLDIAFGKKAKAEEALLKVERLIQRREPSEDRETITEEERYTLQRLGLKMEAFLLLGRRGVYSGIVENMHLHWKYREVVKVIYKGKNRVDIEDTAKMLEAESGGILVAVVPTSKGQALLYYRGKNYQRPDELRPRNLLTKRKALERYTENQRRESLNRHILSLEHDIQQLGYMLEKMKGDESGTAGDVNGSDSDGETAVPDNIPETEVRAKPRRNPRAVELGPILRAEPLTNRERLLLRKQALQMGKPSHFHIGKCNLVGGLIRSIRIYLKKHALVKIGIKGRALGTSAQEIIKLIEDGTGAAFVCHELHKLIFYRGWPEGTTHPAYMEEDLSYELISAVKEEDEMDFSFAGSKNSANLENAGTLFLKSGESSSNDINENRAYNNTGEDTESSGQQKDRSDNDKEDYSHKDLSIGEGVAADYSSSHDDLSSGSGYRSSEEDSAYTTGDETDEEVWSY